MLRLLAFFAVVLLLTPVLAGLPVVGALFRVPFFGFWLTAILLSWGLSKGTEELLHRRRRKGVERQLGATDTPYNRGKLGAFLLSQGRTREALEHLEAAHEGEPASADWAYRLGQARLRRGDAAGALTVLERALEQDEEHAYGGALLEAARAERASGDLEAALARLDRHERNHGPTFDALRLRAVVLRGLGRGAEAAQAADRAGEAMKHVRDRGPVSLWGQLMATRLLGRA